MSRLNSAKRDSAGSVNVSIAKAQQNRDSALTASQQLASGAVNAANAAASIASTGAGPIPTFTGCTRSAECAEGWACIDGTCTDMGGLGSDRIATAGDCDLPDDQLAKNPCGKPGGCDKSTCGEDLEKGEIDCCGGTIYRGFETVRIGTDPETFEPITKQTWREQCEPISTECDQYADFWYKATGDLLSGYDASQICTSCNECGAGKICRPLSEAMAPCYCYPGICKDKEGPCFECDADTGDCNETCTGCVAECNQFFTCPCDKSQTRYEAKGSFNPCTSTSGGCWEPTAEKIKSFCEETFPCEDENQCKGNCQTLKGTSGYPSCPEGKICSQNGFIANAETGDTTYFLTACDTKSNCGCAASPDSPLYQACGECEICENGSCVRDPDCGEFFYEPYGAWYRPYGWNYTIVDWNCVDCNGTEPGSYWWNYTPCNNYPLNRDYYGRGILNNCDPSLPFCNYPDEWPYNNGNTYIWPEYLADDDFGGIWSDGVFTHAAAGSVVNVYSCGTQDPDNVPYTQVQIGAATFQRIVNIGDDYSQKVIQYRVMATFTRPRNLTQRSMANRQGYQNAATYTSIVETLKVTVDKLSRPPRRWSVPISQWPADYYQFEEMTSWYVIDEENFPPNRPDWMN